MVNDVSRIDKLFAENKGEYNGNFKGLFYRF